MVLARVLPVPCGRTPGSLFTEARISASREPNSSTSRRLMRPGNRRVWENFTHILYIFVKLMSSIN